jgi:Cu-Zn family superoxide dismutase
MKRAAGAVLLLTASGCATLSPPLPALLTAVAEIRNAAGQPLGTATLSQVTGGVRVVMEVRGLPPGPKGVHLHEAAKCDPPEFTSAGGHFNPEQKQHGLLNAAGPHAGDLPNVTITADGAGRLESFSDRVTLEAGPKSLLGGAGTALVIHAAPDDFRTDPTGNSGARLACGVITKP